MEASFRKIYKDNHQLMSGLLISDIAVPDAYKSAVQYVLNIDLQKYFVRETLKVNELKNILNKFKTWGVSMTDEKGFKLAASERIYAEIKMADYIGIPLSKVERLNEILTVLSNMNIKINVWKSQTLYFNLLKQYESGSRTYLNSEWEREFLKLGNLLDVRTK